MSTVSEDALRDAAAQLAQRLKPGQCVLFFGPMGVGKTTMISQMVTSLGGQETVSSPTFALAHHYPSLPPTMHLDLYRLENPGDLLSIDIDRYLYDMDHIVLVEWAERLGEYTPSRYIRVDLQFSGPTTRTLTITPVSPQQSAC
jgi:tRNA threonylcarbamoyladenosine biosynthesis protein TsaE